MADENSGRAPRGGAMSYGMGPVMTAGALTVGLLGAGLFGGGTMLQQMAQGPQEQPPAVSASPTPGQSQDDPSADPSTDPSASPSPDDDQTSPGGGDPTDGPSGEPTAPGDQSSPDPGTGSDDNGDDTTDDQPTTPPGHPGDPGDWEYNSQGDVLHTVQWGDTLSSISSQYGVSVDQLAWYNGIKDVNLIYEDSILRVPVLAIPGPEDLQQYEDMMSGGK